MDKEKLFSNKDFKFIVRELSSSNLFENVLFELCERNILSPDNMQYLFRRETTVTNQAKILLEFLCAREDIQGSSGSESIVEAFYRTGFCEIANHLSPQSSATYRTRDSNSTMKCQQLPHIPPSASAPTLFNSPHSPHNPEMSASYPSALNDFHTSESLEVIVRPAEKIYGNHETIYRNESIPRGYVFLANVSQFQGDMHPARIGSDIDVRNLESLFTQMGYDVQIHSDPTKGELLKEMRNFCDDERLSHGDSCVVVVMTHGSDNAMVMADNKLVRDMDIIRIFNNDTCRHLLHKPKIFIFQYCRGGTADAGVDPSPVLECVSNVIRREGVESTDGRVIGETIQLTPQASYSDIFCIYPSVEGFVAYLDKHRGSWLVESICKVFMDHAHDNDLEMLMKKVAEKIMIKYSHQGRKQVPVWQMIGFPKHFYFNPRPRFEL